MEATTSPPRPQSRPDEVHQEAQHDRDDDHRRNREEDSGVAGTVADVAGETAEPGERAGHRDEANDDNCHTKRNDEEAGGTGVHGGMVGDVGEQPGDRK